MQCWDECAKLGKGNSADQKLEASTTKPIPETWPLNAVSILQQDTLVLVHIAFNPEFRDYNQPHQCLVTWEVSGGGLMGNLLTEGWNVELSLWPETKYRVQVTCKNRVSIIGLACIPSLIHLSFLHFC